MRWVHTTSFGDTPIGALSCVSRMLRNSVGRAGPPTSCSTGVTSSTWSANGDGRALGLLSSRSTSRRSASWRRSTSCSTRSSLSSVRASWCPSRRRPACRRCAGCAHQVGHVEADLVSPMTFWVERASNSPYDVAAAMAAQLLHGGLGRPPLGLLPPQQIIGTRSGLSSNPWLRSPLLGDDNRRLARAARAVDGGNSPADGRDLEPDLSQIEEASGEALGVGRGRRSRAARDVGRRALRAGGSCCRR